jgi:uncharacterized damage-inducible protein DinB
MIDREQLIAAFARNLEIVKLQTAGLTHADSLLQPPFRANCLNWVLGHLADNRSSILKALGRPPLLSDEQSARYGYGSEPVTCEGSGVMRMEDLLAALERAQEGIAEGLRQATPEVLARQTKFAGRDMSVGEQVFFLYFHETYHVGQTELLRQLAGTDDQVI